MKNAFPYTFRLATLNDLETLVTHRFEMFSDMGMGEKMDIAAMRKAFIPWVKAQMEAGTYLTFLAEQDGQVVAGAALMLVNWPPGHLDASPMRGYLLNVYTHPEHRRKGLARMLVDQVMDECRRRKIKALSLHASEHGRPMYEKLGFQNTNEMRIILGAET
ncbi:GNAT family N-acetyltransferase [Deinococcus roseus]|uniref:N-acetyltransferase n=1 Tax=Deinococcus roseus TaxID=392414 RepID=A0ABQ2D370_9DEIO|nr:GNAT family N-acetyltransferase [Deinococcus roseus]GGJ35104.1 N-acetyltransferase [Deinococcus roseus]